MNPVTRLVNLKIASLTQEQRDECRKILQTYSKQEVSPRQSDLEFSDGTLLLIGNLVLGFEPMAARQCTTK